MRELWMLGLLLMENIELLIGKQVRGSILNIIYKLRRMRKRWKIYMGFRWMLPTYLGATRLRGGLKRSDRPK